MMNKKRAESLFWKFAGKGLASFGENGKPSRRVLPEPGEGEVLVRVDALTLCASDVKMIHLGNAYPLFKDRDFENHPAVLGHEVSLTVEKPGKGMEKSWPAGLRIGVQPDVYLNGERFCIGVNVEGGMAQYMMLSREVFISDHGSTAFPVPNVCSYAEIAQLEPIACVEAAFRDWTRNRFKREGSLLIHIAADVAGDYYLDEDLAHHSVVIEDPGGRIGAFSELTAFWRFAENEQKGAEEYDDVLILGAPKPETVSRLTERVAPGGLFCWLPDREIAPLITVDMARIHYRHIGWRGCATRRLSDAMSPGRVRNDYASGGKLLIVGGAGAMGRIHTLRALQTPDGPKTIVVTNLTEDRLLCLTESFGGIAEKNGVRLCTLATEDSGWRDKLAALAGPDGFSDIVICAPSAQAATEVVPYLAKDGLIQYFAGVSYGQPTQAPLGLAAQHGASIRASSGSSAQDQLKVLDAITGGRMNPNANVAAIVGMNALKEAVLAVSENSFAGKVVLYPQLEDLPLTPLESLGRLDSALASFVQQHGWCREAERRLYAIYCSGE